MIRHICMFKLNEDNKISNLDEFVSRAKTLKKIPEIQQLEVVCNGQDMPESNYDVALICDFKDKDALDRYQAHPIHLTFGSFVATVRQSRACIDYYLEG